ISTVYAYNNLTSFYKVIPLDNSSDFILLSKSSSTILIYRVSSLGLIIWAKEYSLGSLRFPEICKGLSNEFYVSSWVTTVGSISDDLLIFMIDENGNILWSKSFDDLDDQMNDMACKRSGELVVAGGIHSGVKDQFLLEIDENGNVTNMDRHVSTLSVYEEALAIDINSANEIYIGGHASINSSADAFISKLDQNFNTIWSTIITMPGPNTVVSITSDAAGNSYVSYYFTVSPGNDRPGITKLDAQGNHLWSKALPQNKRSELSIKSNILSEQLLLYGTVVNHSNGFGNIDAYLAFQDTSLSGCIDSIIQPAITSQPWLEYDWIATETTVTLNTITVTDSVFIPNFNSTVSCDTCFIITVPPINNSISLIGNDSICQGDSTRLESIYVSSYSYQWLKYGIPISGATQSYYYAKKTGNYKVRITDQFGNTSTSGKISVRKIVPQASITALGPTVFCSGDNVILQANPGSGYSYSWYKSGNVIPGAASQLYTASKKGKHKVLITDNIGCQNFSNKITINKYPSPSVSINLQGTISICQGSNITLTAIPTSGIPPYTYQWKRYKNILPGANSQSYTTSKIGNYKVTVTDNNSCSRTTPIATKIVKIACPSKISNESTLLVYPNPVKDLAKIQYSIDEPSFVILCIYDVLGNKIEEIVNSNQDRGDFVYQWDSKNQSAGLYFISLQVNDKKVSTKLTLMK
ncbi:MAG: T9SS type A sorting domain-containing protein, partial [Bacteroidia bacterium]|nr:T9SS type A sorting domain-containing protein [Bacteroidia bacterium]